MNTLRSVRWTFTATALKRALVILLFLYIARMIDSQALGLFGTYTRLITLLTTFAVFSLDALYIVEKDPDRMYPLFISLPLVLGAILTILLPVGSGLIARLYKTPELQSLILYTFPILLFYVLRQVLKVSLKKEFQFKQTSIFETVNVLLYCARHGDLPLLATQHLGNPDRVFLRRSHRNRAAAVQPRQSISSKAVSCAFPDTCSRENRSLQRKRRLSDHHHRHALDGRVRGDRADLPAGNRLSGERYRIHGHLLPGVERGIVAGHAHDRIGVAGVLPFVRADDQRRHAAQRPALPLLHHINALAPGAVLHPAGEQTGSAGAGR